MGTILMIYYKKNGCGIFSGIPNQLEQVISAGAGKIHLENYSFGDSLHPEQNQFAWLPWNLFIGPAGKFRGDDPSQGNDRIPLSMPDRNDIETLNTCLQGLGVAYPPQSEGASYPVNIAETKFNKFVMNAVNIMNKFNPEKTTPYDSLIKDWVLKGLSSSRSTEYNVFLTSSPTLQDSTEKKYYQFYVRTNSHRPSKVVRVFSKSESRKSCGGGRIIDMENAHEKQGGETVSSLFPGLKND
jgi:hypothetical protein